MSQREFDEIREVWEAQTVPNCISLFECVLMNEFCIILAVLRDP